MISEAEVEEVFHPALPTLLNEERVKVETSDTVSVRVICVVLVTSGLITENVVEAYAGGVTVAVSESVVCGSADVALEISTGISTVVVATVTDAPLDGELPLIQLVVPEFAANMYGVVLEAPAATVDESSGVT